MLDRLCIKESRSFCEFCMDMRFVDLYLHDIIFGRISGFASGKNYSVQAKCFSRWCHMSAQSGGTVICSNTAALLVGNRGSDDANSDLIVPTH